jgi:acyl-coenzyme A thioesterase PaaI-like protein
MPQETRQRLSAGTHQGCIVCGNGNDRGLNLDYKVEGPDRVWASFKCSSVFDGYKGMVHGGIITSILDGAMLHCLFSKGLTAVTVDIRIRFRHPLLSERSAKVSANIDSRHGALYFLSASIIQDGHVAADAKARFFDKPGLDQ